MREEDTGLRQETLVHVVTLYERIVARALMNRHNVNTRLVKDGQWNAKNNSIYVAFTQNRVLYECHSLRRKF